MTTDTHFHQRRSYRNLIHCGELISSTVTVQETDIIVYATHPVDKIARERIFEYRGIIEAYIRRNPEFMTTLVTWRDGNPVPAILQTMIEAGKTAGVGPMASVAGAIAEFVGRDLLIHSTEIIVENGGDIFLSVHHPITVGLYAGKSPLSLKVGMRVPASGTPLGICTSSGTIGHSLSMGRADAVCVVSDSCTVADAAATAIGNRVAGAGDIQGAVEFGKTMDGVIGLVIILGKDMGLWGDIEIVPLGTKKA